MGVCTQLRAHLHHFRRMAWIAAALAVAGTSFWLTPAREALDGLLIRSLFLTRGALPAPAEVLVVGIDRPSVQALGLPDDPAHWPRRLHAHTVEQLARAGATAIAFDMHFAEADADDALFATALRRAGNVVLFSLLRGEAVAGGYRESLKAPQARLASAAAATAPFPLPKWPLEVRHCWAFKREAGGVPTLPAVAYQIAARDDYARLLPLLPRDTVAGPSGSWPHRMRTLRAALSRTAPVPHTNDARLQRLIDFYTQDDARLINFYGPPRTIATLHYADVVQGRFSASAVSGKAVFIGLSENLEPLQKDGFYTVFSRSDGLDLSGVEIAATAFANFARGESLQAWRGGAQLLFIGFVALGLALAIALPGMRGFAALAASLVAALAAGYGFFVARHTILPLGIPLGVQWPFALAIFAVEHARRLRQSRSELRAAFAHYLPTRLLDRTADRPQLAEGELADAVCLASDAARYTSLAERLPPADLARELNAYYGALFPVVQRHQGIITDVVGDCMMAVWTGPNACDRAVEATLELQAAVDAHNAAAPHALATRFGLHYGRLLLGNVGANQRLEYRAVGDTVNTASRIQALNKALGTHRLVSESVRANATIAIRARDVGRFILVGREQPLRLFELLGAAGHVDRTQDSAAFEDALRLFEAGDFERARATFAALLQATPEDGAARFYLARSELALHDGTITPEPIALDIK